MPREKEPARFRALKGAPEIFHITGLDQITSALHFENSLYGVGGAFLRIAGFVSSFSERASRHCSRFLPQAR